ncbi:MAG: hypothetical protein ACE5O2_07540, partial [Armatimonadota bacterium]
RNWAQTGHPLFSTRQYRLMERTWTWPGRVVYQDLTWRTDWPVTLVVRRPVDLLRKTATGIADLRVWMARATDILIVGLVVGLIVLPAPDRTRRALHVTVIGAIVLQSLVGAVLRPVSVLLLCLLPAAAAVVADHVMRLTADFSTSGAPARRSGGSRAMLVGCLVVLVLVPTLGQFGAGPQGAFPRETMSALARRLPPDAIVMTDVPWAVAWYTGHPAIELCRTDEQFDTISDDVARIDALYFSSDPRSWPVAQRGEWWLMAYNAPRNFKNLLRVPSPAPGAVLRVRRET